MFQLKIQHEDIPGGIVDERDRRFFGVGFTDNFDTTGVDQRFEQPLADQWRILDQQNTERGQIVHLRRLDRSVSPLALGGRYQRETRIAVSASPTFAP